MTSPIHCLSRAVIIQENHLLVSYNPRATHPYTYLPGGHIEEGESAEQALEREMREETTLTFKIERFLGILEHSFVPNNTLKACHTHEYNFCFLASFSSLKGLHLPPEPEHETVRFQWVPWADLQPHNLLPSSLTFLLPLWLSSTLPSSTFVSQMD